MSVKCSAEHLSLTLLNTRKKEKWCQDFKAGMTRGAFSSKNRCVRACTHSYMRSISHERVCVHACVRAKTTPPPPPQRFLLLLPLLLLLRTQRPSGRQRTPPPLTSFRCWFRLVSFSSLCSGSPFPLLSSRETLVQTSGLIAQLCALTALPLAYVRLRALYVCVCVCVRERVRERE